MRDFRSFRVHNPRVQTWGSQKICDREMKTASFQDHYSLSNGQKPLGSLFCTHCRSSLDEKTNACVDVGSLKQFHHHWPVPNSTKRQPSKTILGSKSPASETMWKQKLDSSGRETEGVCKRMDWYNPGPLLVGKNTRASATIQSEAPLIKPTSMCEVNVPKAWESIMASEVSSMLSEGTTELGPGNKGFFTYPFLIPKKKWGKSLYHEPQATEPIHYLHKIQNDHPEADKGGYLSRTVASLIWHQVNILPHSNSKVMSLLPLLPVERQSLPVQDLAFWSIHCSQDLYEGHKTHALPVSEDGYNNFPIPGWCTSTSQLLHSSQGRLAEGGAFSTKTRFCAEPREVPVGTHPGVYTPQPGVHSTEHDLVTSRGQGPGNKGRDSQSGLFPHMQRGD